ncbi:selenide, water dikinase SelD [Umboniibacter marinipuniceus]|uniref:Selenide, water dikinase n=1 Tax=Umboniibacter marinipuniceus TaxID=569599 RepID=A0A3M0AFI1_9GAMM|nr:selenide, water dikinase SelD [Umboniibacter marinipuniceus]RMA81235.1 selenophosphate synthase [Umboniibacter marinipuniceus]
MVKLTQYSHGAGCGCKLSPEVLSELLAGASQRQFENLIVGNDTKDDAAVVDLGDGTGIISTTDFFMPIVDDPTDFGHIAAANAISDIYAMGGTPLMAIAIFGWPIDKLPASVGRDVIQGGRRACELARIPLAGGHSIDSPEPIFGLAVTGRVPLTNLKRNSSATSGDLLLLTKPLGVGILTTAEKRALLDASHEGVAAKAMMELNTFGMIASTVAGVNALTDVTGFGLAGHLLELCDSTALGASISLSQLPVLAGVTEYLAKDCVPGGTHRNFQSYGDAIDLSALESPDYRLICDPQTSGGLLISVQPSSLAELKAAAEEVGQTLTLIGEMTDAFQGVKVMR